MKLLSNLHPNFTIFLTSRSFKPSVNPPNVSFWNDRRRNLKEYYLHIPQSPGRVLVFSTHVDPIRLCASARIRSNSTLVEGPTSIYSILTKEDLWQDVEL